MSTSISTSTSTSIKLFQDFHGGLHTRRLLLHTLYQPPSLAPPPFLNSLKTPENHPGNNSFDANVVMVLSVLLCALICSLGLNSIVRCAIRCSTLVRQEAGGNPSARLANKGVKRKALKTFPTVNYSTELKLPGLDTECAICLSEFAPGERVRLLPKCHHGFHVRCIDKWLSSRSSCPTCRNCLIETCQKIAGHGQASSSETLPPVQETIIQIAPVEPEGLIHGYR